MATLLRWTLITLLLLRMAAGSVWALPSLPGEPPQATQEATAALPCHATVADGAAATSADSHAHPGAGLHGHGAHCALCFPAVAAPVTVVLVPLEHARPLRNEPVGTPWMRAPELRPPI